MFDQEIGGLLTGQKTRFATLVFYNIWIGFGSVILLYSGAMKNINESVIEAGKIDGVGPFKEFIHIVFPSIYPTFVVFFVSGLAGIFTNQLNLFSFYGANAEYSDYTLGYFLYMKTQGATAGEYPYLAAMGILMTLVVVPITFFVNWGLKKIGPKEE